MDTPEVDLSEAKSNLADDPRVAMECVLCIDSVARSRKLHPALDTYCYAIAQECGISVGSVEGAAAVVLSPRLSQDVRRRVAIHTLRLMATREDIAAATPDAQRQITALFDATLERDLYPRLELRARDQG